jgi:hypothetical protein
MTDSTGTASMNAEMHRAAPSASTSLRRSSTVTAVRGLSIRPACQSKREDCNPNRRTQVITYVAIRVVETFVQVSNSFV